MNEEDLIEELEQVLIDSNDIDTTERDRAINVVKFIIDNLPEIVNIDHEAN